ncbi:MAG: adenylate kinase [Bacteroidetes bacterium]|nr:adenylate kinase [Bacteroidota bacterium]
MHNLIFFGPPGSGKGTQALRVAEKFRFIHLSTGDVFRREIAVRSPLGMKVKDVIDRGELVPDSLLIELIGDFILKYQTAQGFVFDGFPRTLPQAEALDSILKVHRSEVTCALLLEVKEEELIRRLVNRAREEGRSDDTEEVIEKRLVLYHQHTKPLTDYYTSSGKLEVVHGIGDIEDIFRNLCKTINKRIKAEFR